MGKMNSKGFAQTFDLHATNFFGYKTKFFPFQIHPKNLDLPYMMDLDLWHYLGRVNLVL